MSAAHVNQVRVERASAERLLASLADRSIDLVITDPPYVTVNRGGSGHLRDWFAHGLTWLQIGRIFAVARRKLKPDGVLMAMTNNDGLREAIGALERAGFVGIRTITWDRQYPGLGGGLRHQCEFIVVGRLPGSRTLSGVDLVSVAAVGPGTAGRYPTMKPDGLGREMAAMAGIGRDSLVVDPFAGSGALLVGAVERGASVVAGDVSKRAVELASARLTAAAPARSSRPSGTSTARPGKPRPTTAVAPARSSRPNGKPRPTTATTRARPGKPSGKPNGKPRPTTATTRARPGKPSGKPNGKPRSSTAAARTRPSRSSGSRGSTTAAARTRSSRSSGSRGSTTAAARTRPGKPSGSRGSSTAAARTRSSRSSAKPRPGRRP